MADVHRTGQQLVLYTRVATADHIYWAVEKLEQLKVGRARVQSRRSTLDETADRVAIASTKARPDVAQRLTKRQYSFARVSNRAPCFSPRSWLCPYECVYVVP